MIEFARSLMSLPGRAIGTTNKVLDGNFIRKSGYNISRHELSDCLRVKMTQNLMPEVDIMRVGQIQGFICTHHMGREVIQMIV